MLSYPSLPNRQESPEMALLMQLLRQFVTPSGIGCVCSKRSSGRQLKEANVIGLEARGILYLVIVANIPVLKKSLRGLGNATYLFGLPDRNLILFTEVNADVLSGGECLECGVHGSDKL